MKKIIILSLLLLQSFTMKLYAQSWSNWVTLSNNKGISASIAFLIRNGKNGGISYWKTSNNTYIQGGSLFFSFDYIDDKGNPHTETAGTMIDLSKTGVVKDAGYLFVCNGGSITNIRVTSIYLPDENASANNNNSRNNGTSNNDNNNSYNNNNSNYNNSYNNNSSYNNNNSNSNNRPLNFGTPQVNSSTNSNTNAAINNYNIAMNRLNNQLQTSQNVYNAVMGGLQQLQQQQQEKYEREQQEEAQREQEEQQEQQRQAQLAEQQREEAQRQAEAQAELSRQWNIDRQTIGGYMVSRKTSEIPGNVKAVYYITYRRNYQTGRLTVHTYTLNKYSDGTWMLQNDLLEKIQFTSYLNSGGVGRCLGFFATKAEAQSALKQIKSNAPNADIDDSFLALNGAAAQTADSDFWNN